MALFPRQKMQPGGDDTRGFYRLCDRSYRNTLHVYSYSLDLITAYEITRGDYSNVTFPLVCTYYQGHKLREVIACNGTAFLIADRVKALLEAHHLTGWETFPVKVYNKKKEEVLGYHGFAVTGRCGPTHRKESSLFQKRYASGAPLIDTYKGVFFNLDAWDGSDFFHAQDKKKEHDVEWGIYISPRAYEVIHPAKIDTFELEHLPDITFTPFDDI